MALSWGTRVFSQGPIATLTMLNFRISHLLPQQHIVDYEFPVLPFCPLARCTCTLSRKTILWHNMMLILMCQKCLQSCHLIFCILYYNKCSKTGKYSKPFGFVVHYIPISKFHFYVQLFLQMLIMFMLGYFCLSK